MAKYIFEVERTYTWNIEIEVPDDKTQEEAKELMLEQTEFEEECAQRGYLEVVDCKRCEDDAKCSDTITNA